MYNFVFRILNEPTLHFSNKFHVDKEGTSGKAYIINVIELACSVFSFFPNMDLLLVQYIYIRRFYRTWPRPLHMSVVESR